MSYMLFSFEIGIKGTVQKLSTVIPASMAEKRLKAMDAGEPA